MLVIHEKCRPAPVKKTLSCFIPAVFFVLQGVLSMELEGEVHDISAQQGIEIPPHAKHRARNNSDAPVEFIVISHPTTRAIVLTSPDRPAAPGNGAVS
ncbi:hypothetical protein EVAR_101267_1 [Eumeta japonica]|uniref:Cupin type-2 domain-containing protein n=1 Tax=Eumeta variegata TaxID=151549 RepID=A0A4C1SN70_EUMVA|nr:hypothetical protein EVAR_101267_1 [Eumeta japonica]